MSHTRSGPRVRLSGSFRNGMRYVICCDRRSPSATACVVVAAGAQDDPLHYSGCAHLVEHVLLTRSADSRAGADQQRLVRLGIRYNAETTREHTRFWCEVGAHATGIETALQHLHGWLTSSPGFSDAVVARERHVVLAELAAQRQDPGAFSRTVLVPESLWGPAHPARGRPVGGIPAEVIGTPPGLVEAFYRAHYRPENCCLAVYGNWRVGGSRNRRRGSGEGGGDELGRLVRLAERMWAPWDTRGGLADPAVRALCRVADAARTHGPGHPLSPASPFRVVGDRGGETRGLTVVTVAWSGPGRLSRRPSAEAVHAVLASLADSAESSALPVALRLRAGVAYQVDADLQCCAHDGVALVQFSVLSPPDVDQGLAVLRDTMERMAREGMGGRRRATEWIDFVRGRGDMRPRYLDTTGMALDEAVCSLDGHSPSPRRTPLRWREVDRASRHLARAFLEQSAVIELLT